MLARAAGQRAGLRPTDRVVPVPLHPRRFRQRGFNPAALLAREIARPLGLVVDPSWLARRRETRPQAGLDARSRERNVAGAFACRRARTPVPKRVWLVDDVMTTGATLASAAAALRRAGVSEVMALCLARTAGAKENSA
jgi:ComF family protein